MADFVLFGLFDNVAITADVIGEVEELGIADNQITVMSGVPYASKFFGRKSPRSWFLPFVGIGAIVGALIAFFIVVITPWLYPVQVGFQPLLAPFPPSAIMFFEFMALGIMVTSFIGFLLMNRFPNMSRQMYDERITDGYIGVQVVSPESLIDQIVGIFEAHRSHVVKREDAAAFRKRPWSMILFWNGVGVGGLVVTVVILLLMYGVIKIPWIDRMHDTVAVAAQEGPRLAAPAESVPVQGPVLIGDQPATQPLEATDTSIQRGKMLFSINCAICHGLAGDREGAEVGKYFQEIPQNLGERAQGLSDNEIFLTITNGRSRMPSLSENLSPGETWDIVNYVRSLSAQSGGAGQ
jgi:mono/diheme cytochrome c family protein